MADYTFTPPTYMVPHVKTGRKSDRLFRYYPGIPTGFTVLIESGVATPYPGLIAPLSSRVAAASSSYQGGRPYVVTEAVQTILVAAGYEDELVVI